MIKFENVSKSYKDGTLAVNSLNLEIQKGEFFVIIGPSGCGKTTTLKMINRLIPLSDGTISINGKKISEYDINELRWNIGYVLQQIALFPHMTIEENISIVPELKKWNREKTQQRAKELLDMVGLEPDTYLNRTPSELSGGQQQRIGVIRALAADPDIVLMDEPFSALDPISREKLQDDLLKLQKNLKKTIVFVTHDMQEALKLADRICVMKDGEIEQLATPDEIIKNPKNNFVRGFIGSNNKHGLNESLYLEKIIQPLKSQIPTCSISASSTLEQALEKLIDQEQVAIEKDGKVIGIINRQIMIQYLANDLQEGGSAHE
ncbi:ABC transporter ATP-binding protein [Rummeliibacillus sp. NPDC094406]|uniref:ABC transporter ATP-binding protein n=1 Tax=Rummeliibacillus sp. NPDC094406 TaxID=3364511 RepID=UPI003817040C